MVPHADIHGRSRQHTLVGGKKHGRGQIVRQATRHLGEKVGGRGRHDHEIGLARETDVTDLGLVLEVEQVGEGFILGETGGVEAVTLTVNQIPTHTHPLLAGTAVASDPSPANKLLGESRPGSSSYFQDVAAGNMAATAIGPIGGSQPHTNLQPFLCVDFIISLFGIFPSPT
jgi:microcystin-dependent protein